ncbi:MAG: zf-HC2 domain-containing protein [Blautia sp.]|nr:zf-HC2 domain-containing protein [Blautia sp.]MDY5032126.1 zf-HC2 domain-containing protein [Blautia sp.]
MDCQKAEEMVNQYMEHILSVDELEEFLDHIEHCPSCYDELETYFIVSKVMEQLNDEDSNTVLDFKALLKNDIRRAKISVHYKRAMRFLAEAGAVLLILLLAGFLFYVMGVVF